MEQDELVRQTEDTIRQMAQSAIDALEFSISKGTFRMDVSEEKSGTYTASWQLAEYLLRNELEANKVTDKCYNHDYVLRCKRLAKSITL